MCIVMCNDADMQMQIYCYEENEFDSIDDALRGNGRIMAMAVLFEVSLCFSVYQHSFFFLFPLVLRPVHVFTGEC